MKGFIDEKGTPYMQVLVKGRRDEIKVLCIVDTGFTGALCLPISIAVNLGLELWGEVSVRLGDGYVSEGEMIFNGFVLWDGQLKEIDIQVTKLREALIGTELLKGYTLKADFETNELIIQTSDCRQ